jgi:hypothetical protein
MTPPLSLHCSPRRALTQQRLAAVAQSVAERHQPPRVGEETLHHVAAVAAKVVDAIGGGVGRLSRAKAVVGDVAGLPIPVAQESEPKELVHAVQHGTGAEQDEPEDERHEAGAERHEQAGAGA